jgi:CheY-like chemotaxis protein
MHKSILDQKKVLAVDDEQDILTVLEEEIKSSCLDCTVDMATSYDEAVKRLESGNYYDLIILDIMGVRGFDLLEIAVKKGLKAVMLTAHGLSPDNLKRAHDMGARAYLPKDKMGEIVPFLEDALKYEFEAGWKHLYEALRDVFADLWGRDWDKLGKYVGIDMPKSDT